MAFTLEWGKLSPQVYSRGEVRDFDGNSKATNSQGGWLTRAVAPGLSFFLFYYVFSIFDGFGQGIIMEHKGA